MTRFYSRQHTTPFVWFIAICGLALSGCESAHRTNQTATSADQSPTPRVGFDIECDGSQWGTIVFELDRVRAPLSTANFLRYVDEGYYDHTLIHRVVVGPRARIQVFQGGGYTVLNGKSKPGQHAPIQNEAKNGLNNVRGTIAMARDAAPHTATSEYFVNIGDNPSLDCPSRDGWGYCVFGRVVQGWDVVDRIAALETRRNPDPELKGEKSQPISPPVVIRARRVDAGDRT